MPQYHPGVNTWDPKASLDYAANLMSSLLKQYGGDWAKALIAYNGGGGAVQAWDSGKPYQESQTYVSQHPGQQPSQPDRVRSRLRNNTSSHGAPQQTAMDQSQFNDPQLTTDEAYSACGPAAAVRFAQAYGRNPTLREATDLAKTVGWTAQQGMAGIVERAAAPREDGHPHQARRQRPRRDCPRSPDREPGDHQHPEPLLLRRRLQPADPAVPRRTLRPRPRAWQRVDDAVADAERDGRGAGGAVRQPSDHRQSEHQPEPARHTGLDQAGRHQRLQRRSVRRPRRPARRATTRRCSSWIERWRSPTCRRGRCPT